MSRIDRQQGDAVINGRPQHRRRDEQKPDREQEEQGDTGNGEPSQTRESATRQPVGHADRQTQEQQNGHDIEQPLADFRQCREGGDDPLMVHRQLAEMHAQPGHQTIQDQLQERDQQHELDRVLKEERLIAELPCDPLHGRSWFHHVYSTCGT